MAYCICAAHMRLHDATILQGSRQGSNGGHCSWDLVMCAAAGTIVVSTAEQEGLDIRSAGYWVTVSTCVVT
jgi:hypothetical protein